MCKFVQIYFNGFIWKYEGDSFKKIFINNAKRKPVLKYDLNNELICEYVSITEAAKDNDLTWDIIKSHLNNGKKTKNNFIWKFKNNMDNKNNKNNDSR